MIEQHLQLYIWHVKSAKDCMEVEYFRLRFLLKVERHAEHAI